ncbi:MAG: ATP-binding protein, partial [Pseudonocardiaceae bacterium]
LEALLRRLRLPHIRRHAPEVIATAKAQRWEPVEVLRALFVEEAAGRERSALATRRAAAAFPTGKTFDAWQTQTSSIPAPTQSGLPVVSSEKTTICYAGADRTVPLLAV